MAEFQEVMREWVRSRKAINENKLSRCPLEMFSDDHIANIEKEVMAWAAENPEPEYPTWEEWLQSVGVMESSERLLRRIQGQLLIDGIPIHAVPTSKVLQPMDADIAQKLGIEPKEK